MRACQMRIAARLHEPVERIELHEPVAFDMDFPRNRHLHQPLHDRLAHIGTRLVDSELIFEAGYLPPKAIQPKAIHPSGKNGWRSGF